MTTAAQVKTLVQPLLERSPDLVWVRREIYLKPVRHFARMVLIDRLGDPEAFRPRWAVAHLFQVRTSLPLSWGEHLRKQCDAMPASWLISDPNVSEMLIESIELDALPVLRAMQTFEDYLAFVSANYFRHQLFEWPEAKVILDVALGNFDAARALCEANIQHWAVDKTEKDVLVRKENQRLHDLRALLRVDDRAGLARLLREWEAQSVKNLKIAHLWEPAPFPLELQAAP